MQRLEIIGHIGKDAEIKDFNGNQVINFSVAVTESFTNYQGAKQQNTTWYEVSKWGNNTSLAQYLKKGTQVFVSGKPSARVWTNQEGTAIPVLCLTALQIQLLSSVKSENTNTNNASVNTPQNNEAPNDDLPF